MAATTQLWCRATSRLVMSGGDKCGGQFLGTHGIHNRMFSTRGTHNYYEDYNYKPPEHYNDNYCYKPYNNSSNECSSRDKYFKDISEKYIPIKMKYDFEKLEYRILRMEYNFEKHYEKLHRAFQKSINEIRDERKKLVLDSNTEKLTNELNTVIHYTMRKLTNDLIQVCAKYVVKPKVDVYDHVLVCKENMAKPKAAVDDHDHTVVHEENVSDSDSESNSKSEEEESEVEEEESEKSEKESEEEKSEEEEEEEEESEEKEESEKESEEEEDDKSDESKVAGDEQSMLHLQKHLLNHLLKRLSSDPSFKHLTRQKALKKE